MTGASWRKRFTGWLHDRPDDAVLRALFAAMLVGTGSVLALDYQELAARAPDRAALAPARTPAEPLPAANPERDATRPASHRQADESLRKPMTFELIGDGRLLAVGTIAPGTAQAFTAEIDKRGGYVKTVVLRSPGGSVTDALAMGRLIRAKGFATAVEADGYCASSCPLVFAGGIERRAAAKAMIGVHQVATMAVDGGLVPDGARAAQRVSAACQRYLLEMGIDLQVWVHAMETPKERLHYFNSDELLTLKLATASTALATGTGKR
jgi:hypothetical protein